MRVYSFAIAALVPLFMGIAALDRSHDRSSAPVPLAPSPHAQDATALLTIRDSPGDEFWPNDGTMPLLTYGWSGDRPKPVPMAVDSSLPPVVRPGRPPLLIIQHRSNIFSPLLERVLSQDMTIHRMTIRITRTAATPLVYTMRDVRILGIRQVGKVIEENPVTEEVVFIFSDIRAGDE